MVILNIVKNSAGQTIGYDVKDNEGKINLKVSLQDLLPYTKQITNAVYVRGEYPYFKGKKAIPVRKEDTTKLILYHGSKSGLQGSISCNYGRKLCDFGQGFYLGTQIEQPQGLIASYKYPNAVLYTMELDLTGLKVVNLKDGMFWMLFVCYNRGRLDFNNYSQMNALVAKFQHILQNADVIIGTIADDKMSMVLEDFYSGARSDIGVLESLKYVNLGKQVVLKSEKACRQVKVIKKAELTPEMRKEAMNLQIKNQQRVSSFVTESLNKDNTTMRGHRFAWILANWEEYING